jgi:hypothetical protein
MKLARLACASALTGSLLFPAASGATEPPKPLDANKVKTKVEGPGSMTLVLIPADEVPGMKVRLDGELLARESLNGSLAVPTGEHVLEVSAPGYKTARITAVVEPGAPAPLVRIPSLDELPKEAAPKETSAKAGSPEQPVASAQILSPSSSKSSSFFDAPRIIGLGVAGVGLVGVGIGVILGFSAKSTYDQSSAFCAANQCRKEGLQFRQDGFSQAGVATGVLAGGAILAAAGLATVLFFPRADRPNSSSGASPWAWQF